MSESALKITEFERRVTRRSHLLALQDNLALALTVGCVVVAAAVLLAKMREGGSIPVMILALALSFIFSMAYLKWRRACGGKRDSAFLIDRNLELEDRLSTAHEIIEKGGPRRDVETALVDDAAARLAGKSAREIVPYRIRKWYAAGLIGVAALAAALIIPQRALPGGQAIVEARADIESAGEQLEQKSEEVAQAAPEQSETAKLAKEQKELGRMFRISPETRAEALKKLSALEDRIRKRHNELAETHADEIVDLANQRLKTAVRPAQRKIDKESAPGEERADSDLPEENPDDQTTANSNAARPANARAKKAGLPKSQTRAASTGEARKSVDNRNGSGEHLAANQPESTGQQSAGQSGQEKPGADPSTRQQEAAKGAGPQSQNQTEGAQAKSQNRPQEPVSGSNATGNKGADGARDPNSATARNADRSNASASDNSNRSDENQGANNQAGAEADQKKEEGKNPSGGLTGLMAEQAAKALPNMSEELLKKAAQLRAGQLSAEDLKGLQQAAEMLARDLPRIAQSKALQQAAEQLARQITPEQIEQFARQLGDLEHLKKELEASARLLMQNQEAKSMVAGLAQKFAKMGEEFRAERGRGEQRAARPQGARPNGQAQGEQNWQGRSGADEARRRAFEQMSGGLTPRSDGPIARTGAGKETRLSGAPQRGTGGEYLYLRSQAGGGAARAPYSSAYPQYRRQAERSVERSQVPPRMRSMVRSYFDAINPDSAKKP